MPQSPIDDEKEIPAEAEPTAATEPARERDDEGDATPAERADVPAPDETPAPDKFREIAKLLDRVNEAETAAGDGAGTADETLARAAEFLREKRANGLSVADAVNIVREARGDVPALDLIWEKPEADTMNVRERKFAAAENLGAAFPRASGALTRAAGTIASPKWSAAWQSAAEKAAENFAEAAEAIAEKAADFTAATGLLPLAGTLGALKNLLKLVGALLAVRGEPDALVLGADAEKTLATLREAAALAESCARHKALLSLPYPENACENPHLEEWLKLWNEAEISRALPRWRKRRKVVRALRELAGNAEKEPLDPRVDLGNLIALRASRSEFSEKFSETEAAFPSLIRGLEPCGALARIDALEKARAAVAAALAELECFPEKRDAWQTAFSRWLGGNDAAFAPGGAVEKALRETKSALAKFDECRTALFDATGTAFSANARSAQDAAAFAREMLADRKLWRDVCDWNRAALAAERRGMAALAEAVRAGTVPAERSREIFEVNYCRRWAEAVAGTIKNDEC